MSHSEKATIYVVAGEPLPLSGEGPVVQYVYGSNAKIIADPLNGGDIDFYAGEVGSDLFAFNLNSAEASFFGKGDDTVEINSIVDLETGLGDNRAYSHNGDDVFVDLGSGDNYAYFSGKDFIDTHAHAGDGGGDVIDLSENKEPGIATDDSVGLIRAFSGKDDFGHIFSEGGDNKVSISGEMKVLIDLGDGNDFLSAKSGDTAWDEAKGDTFYFSPKSSDGGLGVDLPDFDAGKGDLLNLSHTDFGKNDSFQMQDGSLVVKGGYDFGAMPQGDIDFSAVVFAGLGAGWDLKG